MKPGTAVTLTGAALGIAAVVVAMFVFGMGSILAAALGLATLAAWEVVWSLALKRLAPPTASTPATPDPGQLANDAQAARRHALEYGLPTDPWTQLEGFWTASGDLVTVIDDIQPPAEPRDPFMDEVAAAMCAPIEDKPRIVSVEDLDREIKRLEREIDEPFNLDNFVARTKERERRRLADAVSQGDMTVEEADGKYQRTAQDPTVRCTWTLTGTPEDDHVIRALRDAGVHVAIESTDVKTAHLAGHQSAINDAKRAYTDGWRQRRTHTGIGPPPGATQATPNTPNRSLAP